jgi:hypothetical protein
MALIIQSWLWLLSFIDTSGFCFRTCLIDGNELYNLVRCEKAASLYSKPHKTCVALESSRLFWSRLVPLPKPGFVRRLDEQGKGKS